jgi:hypothetical protein
MPVNIIVGIVSLLVALVLYTVATIRAFRKKTLTSGIVGELWTGVVFDILATTMMAIQIGGLDFSAKGWLHTVLALIAFFGMLTIAAVGTWAYRAKNEKLMFTLSRVVLAPWALWVGVFVWGMLERGSKRL